MDGCIMYIYPQNGVHEFGLKYNGAIDTAWIIKSAV